MNNKNRATDSKNGLCNEKNNSLDHEFLLKKSIRKFIYIPYMNYKL